MIWLKTTVVFYKGNLIRKYHSEIFYCIPKTDEIFTSNTSGLSEKKGSMIFMNVKLRSSDDKILSMSMKYFEINGSFLLEI